MPDVEVIQVIHTRLLKKGTGRENSPIRIVDQYWLMDGSLLFEKDPIKEESNYPDS